VAFLLPTSNYLSKLPSHKDHFLLFSTSFLKRQVDLILCVRSETSTVPSLFQSAAFLVAMQKVPPVRFFGGLAFPQLCFPLLDPRVSVILGRLSLFLFLFQFFITSIDGSSPRIFFF